MDNPCSHWHHHPKTYHHYVEWLQPHWWMMSFQDYSWRSSLCKYSHYNQYDHNNINFFFHSDILLFYHMMLSTDIGVCYIGCVFVPQAASGIYFSLIECLYYLFWHKETDTCSFSGKRLWQKIIHIWSLLFTHQCSFFIAMSPMSISLSYLFVRISLINLEG